MPLPATGIVRLENGTLGELYRELGRLLSDVGPDAVVVTEVGLNGGRDVFIGGKALNVRRDWRSIVISADEVR